MRRKLILGGIVATILALGATGYVVFAGNGQAARALGLSPDPVLDCPEIVDLGEREVYTPALSRITVTNSGGRTLTISDIRTTCSCAGLEQELNGKYVRVSELEVPPKGSVELAIRVTLPGPGEGRFETPVYFRTNDPSIPQWTVRVVAHIAGGVDVHPRAVAFGAVRVGEDARRVIDVRNLSKAPRTVERISSTNPDRIRVKQLPPTEDGQPDLPRPARIAGQVA